MENVVSYRRPRSKQGGCSKEAARKLLAKLTNFVRLPTSKNSTLIGICPRIGRTRPRTKTVTVIVPSRNPNQRPRHAPTKASVPNASSRWTARESQQTQPHGRMSITSIPRGSHPVHHNSGNDQDRTAGPSRGGVRRWCLAAGTGAVVLVLWTVLVTLVILIAQAFRLVVPPRRIDISGDVVLVTNAGRGLGRRLAVRFGLAGAGLVVCWDPDADRCMNTVYEVRHRGGGAVGYTVDVSDEAAVVAGAAVLRREVGHVRVLVLNIGRLPLRPLMRFTVADIQTLWNSNVLPHFVHLKVFVPPMVEQNAGHVVYISSASSILPSACEGPYVATKMAVSGMIRGLREELAALPRNKVRVSCVYPYLPPRRTLEGITCEPQWGRHTLDEMARQIVDGVLRGRDSIFVPRCPVFWMRVLRALPLSVQRRWRRLLLQGTYADPSAAFQYPPDPHTETGLRSPWSERRLSSTPPYEMVSEQSSSWEILPIGFRKTCRIQIP